MRSGWFSMARRWDAVAFFLLCLIFVGSPDSVRAEDRVVVDSVGRTVTVPATVERVFAAGPPASVLIYMLAPQKLLGWPGFLMSEKARDVLPPRYANLPGVGSLGGRGATASGESIAALHPDLILDAGSIGQSYISMADRIQAQTHIPYVLIDGRIADTPAMLRRAGDLLGVPERAELLAGYAEKVLGETKGRIDSQTGVHRPTVYYARSANGLEAGLKGSISAELIDYLGAVNVVENGEKGGVGQVSMEQVMGWDPDVIIAGSAAFFDEIHHQPLWQSLRAVREHRVYLAPSLPFGWIDGPPGANRLIGVRWLAARLYPTLFPEDLRNATREFYGLFYDVHLSDEELDHLLGPS